MSSRGTAGDRECTVGTWVGATVGRGGGAALVLDRHPELVRLHRRHRKELPQTRRRRELGADPQAQPARGDYGVDARCDPLKRCDPLERCDPLGGPAPLRARPGTGRRPRQPAGVAAAAPSLSPPPPSLPY